MSDIHDAMEIAEAAGLQKVRSWTYPGSYAFVPATSLMAEQVRNRDSASWKKAEHIILIGLHPDKGISLLPYWNEFAETDPDEKSKIQKLYVRVAKNVYIVYNALGEQIGNGTLTELLK